MIPNGEGWHYLAVKKTISIIKRNNIKYNVDYHSLNCLHSFRNKLESHKKYVKIKIFVMFCCPLKTLKY